MRNQSSRSFLFIMAAGLLLFNGCRDEVMQDPLLSESDEKFSSEEIADRYIVIFNPEAIDYPKDFKLRTKEALGDFIFRQAETMFQQYGNLEAQMSIDYVYTHSIVGFAGGDVGCNC